MMIKDDTIERFFARWLAAMDQCPALPTQPVAAREVFDELGSILRLQDTRNLAHQRLGSWRVHGPWNLPGSDSHPDGTYDCIGHAANGDLFCAVRTPVRAATNVVWLFDHERNQLTHPVADSIAAFAFMAALDGELAKGPQYFEPDEGLLAQRDVLDDDAYDALYDAASEAFENAVSSQQMRRFAQLSGRVAPPWMFTDLKSHVPAHFVRFDPSRHP